MDLDDLERLMAKDPDAYAECDTNDTIEGLNIIARYFPKDGIQAEHDQIFSVDAEKLVGAGLTTADAHRLRSLGWFICEDHLSCYV